MKKHISLDRIIQTINSSNRLPTLTEIKNYAKQLKDVGAYEKKSFALNAIAKKLGYRKYNDLKPKLSDEVEPIEVDIPKGPQVISADYFKAMMKEEIFSQKNPRINFKDENKFENQKNIIDGIPVDPILPEDFTITPNEEREEIELLNWWDKPYIETDTLEQMSYIEYKEHMTKHDLKAKDKDSYLKELDEDKTNWYKEFPTGIRYQIRILDGGAWDRPTHKGFFSSLDEAVKYSQKLLESIENDS